MSIFQWSILGIIVVSTGLLLFVLLLQRKSLTPDQSVEKGNSYSDGDVNRMISEYVTRKVREGFDTREEIIEFVSEIIEDECKCKNIRERVAQDTDSKLEKHFNNQSSWPILTDCDRIDAAFAELETTGIVARQNFACCQNCGHAEIGDEIEEFSKTAKPIGYTFYHMQDTERVCEDGTLYLAYGSVKGTDEDALKIGEMIRNTLEKHGLKVEWNGSIDSRICIHGIDWKKRRRKE